jgi:toxin ParE1/3/4
MTGRAQRDFGLLYLAIDAGSSDIELQWYRGFKRAVLSLEEKPNRCSATPENGALRHLLYGAKPRIYRAIFRVLEKHKQVDVLHIRHGARQPFKRSEVA